MRTVSTWMKIASLTVFCACSLVTASAQFPVCPPRPAGGGQIQNPVDLYSQNGVLSVDFKMQNEQDPDGTVHYCYDYIYQGQEIESPTLRINPGDLIILNLTNHLPPP